jgi:hypothetical protein
VVFSTHSKIIGRTPQQIITVPNVKLYYRAIAIKTAWYLHKDRHEDHRIEDLNVNSFSDIHAIFDKLP